MNDLETLKRLEADATPRPWLHDADEGWIFQPDDPNSRVVTRTEPDEEGGLLTRADAALIVAARNALPDLIRRIEDLEDLVRRIPAPFIPEPETLEMSENGRARNHNLNPENLRTIALMLDLFDEVLEGLQAGDPDSLEWTEALKALRGTGMQDDLRRWADELEAVI